ncbi:MAG: hypothetical protein IT280_03800 [Ignavibacteria bacterium]|nr:hypothetical protein [Ignavibacteria bacterium]
MKKLLFILLFISITAFTQNLHVSAINNFNISKKTDAANSLILSSILVLTPTLIIENGNSHFGLSKEFSAGKFPYGRAEFDYTYIFRKERKNVLHLSYNLDIPLNGSFKHPSIIMISPGAGYYTDFIHKGYFIQAAIGIWATTGFMEGLSIHPNLKVRKIFVKNNYPGVIELSLGVGFGFYTH